MKTFKFAIEFISGASCIGLYIAAIALGSFILLIIALLNTYIFYRLTKKDYDEYVRKGPPYLD